MIVIATVDDRNGMTFNHRRLSQDRILRARIVSMATTKLWMNSYTATLFDGVDGNICVDEDFLSKAAPGEYCYVENTPVRPYEDRIEKIILCLWNRTYPADTYWDIDMSRWILEETQEFAGSCHKKITMNIWRRTS